MSGATTAAPARRRSPGWVPRQHGAWAMLLLPFVAGAIRSGGDRVQLLLLLTSVTGYLAFQAAGRWVASRRRPRYRPPVLVYGGLFGASCIALLLVRPDVLPWVPLYVVAAAVSLAFSWRRRERHLVNDLVVIAAASLLAVVTYQLGYDPDATIAVGWRTMWLITAAIFAYLVGTALYVKTMIRERGVRGYVWASVGYHLAVTAAFAAVTLLRPGPPAGLHHRGLLALTVFFALLTVRAWVLAGRPIRPLVVGLGEIAASLGLLVIVWLWR